MTARIAATSTEFVWLPIRGEHPIDGATDLPTDYPTVRAAFTDADATAAPEVGDWVNAAWESTTRTIAGKAWYLARVTVGPDGAVELTSGRWRVWVELQGGVTPIVQLDDVLVVY